MFQVTASGIHDATKNHRAPALVPKNIKCSGVISIWPPKWGHILQCIPNFSRKSWEFWGPFFRSVIQPVWSETLAVKSRLLWRLYFWLPLKAAAIGAYKGEVQQLSRNNQRILQIIASLPFLRTNINEIRLLKDFVFFSLVSTMTKKGFFLLE